ncbi:hypothetical protein E2C01_030123 [Portunus trituberculatus]|uniref:Uncharacterized protein n=1 Tax=Portunus trituberculatus TaxID=210409 RepID=A0A5B7EU31_PORTR|nr:hypothetical protein [Portunus trituberculatus]
MVCDGLMVDDVKDAVNVSRCRGPRRNTIVSPLDGGGAGVAARRPACYQLLPSNKPRLAVTTSPGVDRLAVFARYHQHGAHQNSSNPHLLFLNYERLR